MKTRFFLFLSLPLLLVSCNKTTNNSNSGENPVDDSSVYIVDPKIDDLYGGTSLKLKTTTSPENLELTWTSSNEEVATVDNGVITFKDVAQEKEVTIKAASKVNGEVFDEYPCSVKPNPIDFDSSDGYDASKFYTTGMILKGNNEKILFNNYASSTFFYKASFNAELMENRGEFGFYLYAASADVDSAYLRIGVDGRATMMDGGFPYLVITKGSEVSKVTLPHDGAFKTDVYRDLAIAKYDRDLYIFGEKQQTLYCAEKFFNTFGANAEFRVGIYTKNFEVAVKSFRTSLNKEDFLFGEPTSISLGADKSVLEGEEFDLQVRGNKLNINPAKITYSSSNDEIASVSTSGHVVAKKEGNAVLKAKYDNRLQATMNVHVDRVITSHSFVMNEANSPTSFDGDVTIYDDHNSPMVFNYVGASSSSGNHAALADGGYIANKVALTDLVQLSINGTGTFKLYTGFEAFENIKTFTLNNSTQAMELVGVSYIKLEAVGAATINNISGVHNNQETLGKDLAPGEAGSTPIYDVCKWTRLIHDIDTSKDFTYTVSFRQITDETNHLKRPAFFVYPAEYNENDEIPYTSTSHYFDGTGGYLHMRQSNSQLCHKTHTNTEKTVCTSDAWIDTHVVGTKEASEGGQYGGTDTTQSRITRDCIITVTFSLENRYEDGQRYQHWFTRIDCESFAVISGTDYSGTYSKTYTLDTTPGNGNIFPCDRIGIAIGHRYDGTYKILSASSTGVR